MSAPTGNAYEALFFVDKTLDNVADLPPDLSWRNGEVIEMLEDIRSLLLTGSIMPGSFTDRQVGSQERMESGLVKCAVVGCRRAVTGDEVVCAKHDLSIQEDLRADFEWAAEHQNGDPS